MLFNSLPFLLLFLPVVWAVHRWVGESHNGRWAMSWLVLASCLFYAYWNPIYLILLISSIVANYTIGRRLATTPGHQKPLLIVGIVGNLGLLGYYKYTGFLLENLTALTGASWNTEHILLPLAISFFSFQQIAYLVDSWRGQTEQTDLLRYALFVSFFPQLIAGPIVHHREILPQLKNTGRRNVPADVSTGLLFLVIGLFKKVVVADGIASFATPVFAAADAGSDPTFFEAWGGTLAYTFQIYYDFSGYSDMAVGLGRMFGIRLPINFRSPYKAVDIVDFWRRWHISLSRFLRDYLYIPLGGNRRGSVRRYTNLMITMLLGGLWHGAGWTFVIWGGIHGVALAVTHIWRQQRGDRDDAGVLRTHISRAITFTVVVVAWTFFRAETLSGATSLLAAMSGSNGIDLPTGLQTAIPEFGILAYSHNWLGEFGPVWGLAWLALLLVVVWFGPDTEDLHAAFSEAMTRARATAWPSPAQWGYATAVLALLSLTYLDRASEFLYFQF